jgi:hypothetical protein
LILDVALTAGLDGHASGDEYKHRKQCGMVRRRLRQHSGENGMMLCRTMLHRFVGNFLHRTRKPV